MKTTIPLLLFALLTIAGCTKDKNSSNRNNNNNITRSKYVELNIGGVTYKYEEYNGNAVRDANGDEESSYIGWNDSSFDISGATNRGGFNFTFPVAVTGTGSYNVPAVVLPTNAEKFSGVATLISNLVYDGTNQMQAMNGGSCDITSQTIAAVRRRLRW